jgi:ribosomal protein L19E
VRKLIVLGALIALLAVPSFAVGHGKHHPAVKAAAAACKSERDADPAAFQAKYANENGKHAFRRCVRQHLRQAVKNCRAEREADRDAFKEKYANDNGRHAFRRCVRQHAGDPVS